MFITFPIIILLLRKDYTTFVHIYQLSMTTRDIIVRKARVEDAEIIARAVEMAIDNEEAVRDYCGDDYLAVLQEIARRKATQYSWTQALVAEVDGVAAGAVVGYDGAQLAKLREGTFEVLMECIGRIPRIDDETEAGEYYLDSVGVLPQYRGMGVGRVLVEAFCCKAFGEGHSCVGLIVDMENPKAEELYRMLGFEQIGVKPFFGHQMRHLQIKK